MPIRWNAYVWSETPLLTQSRLRQAEQRLGVRLPQDYVDCVLQHQGETPEPATFGFGQGYRSVFNELYHFEERPAASSQRLAQQSLTNGEVPAGIIAFAGDPAGNHLCFDFRADPGVPTVVILDYEAAADNPLVPVAESFTALLQMLE